MSNPTKSSYSTQSAPTKTNPLQTSEAQDLEALDRVAGRLSKAKLPHEPYLVTVNGSMIPSAVVGYRWIENTPFSPEEGYLQYQSLLFRHPSESLLQLSSARKLANMQAPNQEAEPAHNTPATTSATSPANTASNTPAGPKKKISLADYRAKKAAAAAGQPLPNPPEPARHQQPDLRKETLKKELQASAQLPPTIVEDNTATTGLSKAPPSAPSAAGTKRPAAELATGETHPESAQAKKQRSESCQDSHLPEAKLHRSAPAQPALTPSKTSPKRSVTDLSEGNAKDSTLESPPAKKQRLDSHAKPAASSSTAGASTAVEAPRKNAQPLRPHAPAPSLPLTSKEKGLLSWLPKAATPPRGRHWIPRSSNKPLGGVSAGLEQEALSGRALGRWLPSTSASENEASSSPGLLPK